MTVQVITLDPKLAEDGSQGGTFMSLLGIPSVKTKDSTRCLIEYIQRYFSNVGVPAQHESWYTADGASAGFLMRPCDGM